MTFFIAKFGWDQKKTLAHSYYQLRHYYEDYKAQEYRDREILFKLMQRTQSTELQPIIEFFDAIKPPHLAEQEEEIEQDPESHGFSLMR